MIRWFYGTEIPTTMRNVQCSRKEETCPKLAGMIFPGHSASITPGGGAGGGWGPWHKGAGSPQLFPMHTTLINSPTQPVCRSLTPQAHIVTLGAQQELRRGQMGMVPRRTAGGTSAAPVLLQALLSHSLPTLCCWEAAGCSRAEPTLSLAAMLSKHPMAEPKERSFPKTFV